MHAHGLGGGFIVVRQVYVKSCYSVPFPVAWCLVAGRGERRQVEQVVATQREGLGLGCAPFVGASADAKSPTVGGRHPVAECHIGLYAWVCDCLFSARASVETQSGFKEYVVAEFLVIEMFGNRRFLQQIVERALFELGLCTLDADEASTDCQYTAKGRSFLCEVIHII